MERQVKQLCSLHALNALLAFMECGPGQCPDNPAGYWIYGG